MKKWLKRGKVLFLVIAAIFLLYLVASIVIAMVTKYKPEKIEVLDITGEDAGLQVEAGIEYDMIIFNTGYCGLDKSQDFFMDGGKNSGAGSKAEVKENLAVINEFLISEDADFLMLQEVDESGKRSYNINQLEAYRNMSYISTFAYNYKLNHLPIPIFNPMGGVQSGIMTLSKMTPASAERYTFDGKPSYIVSLFELDRCFMVDRYPVGDYEFVLINTHFSVFDKGGKIREQQLAQMKKFLIEEYEKGNYVILGGDFNHELPGTSFYDFTDGENVDYPDWAMEMPDDFTPEGYNWGVDTAHPTVRSNNIPLQEGKNGLLTLDGYLVSDNIEIISVDVYEEMGFENSDHNPVKLEFKLLEDEEK